MVRHTESTHLNELAVSFLVEGGRGRVEEYFIIIAAGFY